MSEIENIKAQNEKLISILKFIADYSNYATDGDVETSNGVLHVSNYAENELNAIIDGEQ